MKRTYADVCRDVASDPRVPSDQAIHLRRLADLIDEARDGRKRTLADIWADLIAPIEETGR